MSESLKNKYKYDVVVIGGGHAGCEAALVSAKMGCSTLLVTTTIKKIATMPCNPAIGGPGKGHLVREIDCLGGAMAKVSDQSLIQIKLLNHTKGPAVQAYRAQIERDDYQKIMLETLKKLKKLKILEDEVTDIDAANNPKTITGVKTKSGKRIECGATIITTGTFLNAKIIIGDKIIRKGGRIDENGSYQLSNSLNKIGLKLEKLQTATPPRIDKKSVDCSKMEIQPGTKGPCSFSFPEREVIKYNKQIPCWLAYTNPKTHKIINENINYSPIKSGIIEEHGPRHCPSIDRKVVNFPNKERHPIFVEPEGRKSNRLYLQGLTTAMPEDLQLKIIRSVKGMEKAIILQPGYAVVYDYVPSWQIKKNLETKKIKGLFLAGQVNGTSGYEEAAAQGIMAGINAALKIKNKKPFILNRNQAYIGVMIDDLITKKHKEPYRVYTSAAEYRLLLRQDNADERLIDLAFNLGLVDKKRKLAIENKRKKIDTAIKELKKIKINSKNAWSYLKRPEINIQKLFKITKNKTKKLKIESLSEEILNEVEILAKYEDYIKRQEQTVIKNISLENKKIPKINYDSVPGLKFVAKERLKEVEPISIGQASRIAEVTPADITTLLIFLEKIKRSQKIFKS